jgi:hypothetical protein
MEGIDEGFQTGTAAGDARWLDVGRILSAEVCEAS